MSEPRYRDRPRGTGSLRQRLKNVTELDDQLLDRRLRTMAAVIVAQMLPPALIKGGTSMTLRRGATNSRASADVDAARLGPITEDDFIAQFRLNAAKGWSGFTGTVVERPKRSRDGVADQYVMRPLTVRLSYENSTFRTVVVELAYNELGSTGGELFDVPQDIVDMFVEIGLERPEAVALLPTEHQIAQKLHACTELNQNGTNGRAHDLVDIQILCANDEINPVELSEAGHRVFAIRKSGTWPPTITSLPGWDSIYFEAAQGLGVRPLDEAIQWLNELIEAADLARDKESMP
ncbi:MAG: nucleotidyl transferase AbiEii/AbiGii toxin family protein [Actinomycetota bacterium]